MVIGGNQTNIQKMEVQIQAVHPRRRHLRRPRLRLQIAVLVTILMVNGGVKFCQNIFKL